MLHIIGGPLHGQKRPDNDKIGLIYDRYKDGPRRYYYKRYGDNLILEWETDNMSREYLMERAGISDE